MARKGGLNQVVTIPVTVQPRQEGDPKQAVAMQVTIQSRQALLPNEKKADDSRLVIYVSSLVVFVVQAEPRVPSSLLLRPNSLLVLPRRKPCPTALAS